MTENLFISSHKASTKEFREGWERTFGKVSGHRAHQGDPCIFCGQRHDDIVPGPCPGRYCTVDEHQDLYRQGIKSCPKCGSSTSTQLSVHVEGESNETYQS